MPAPDRETAAAEGTSLPADTSREHLRADLTAVSSVNILLSAKNAERKYN